MLFNINFRIIRERFCWKALNMNLLKRTNYKHFCKKVSYFYICVIMYIFMYLLLIEKLKFTAFDERKSNQNTR